jgi:hypothetical protein
LATNKPAEPFEAFGVMAERLAQRASQAPSPRQSAAAAHLEVAAPYGVKFQSWEHEGVGYVEWAGFVPGQAKVLVAREALYEAGKSIRRFEVMSLNSLTPERWASAPELLPGFRWQDPQWKRHTVALR